MGNKKALFRVSEIILGILGLISFIFLMIFFSGNIENLFLSEGDEDAIAKAFAAVLILLPFQLLISIFPFIFGVVIIIVASIELKKQEKKEVFTIVMLVLGIIFVVGAIAADASIFVIGQIRS